MQRLKRPSVLLVEDDETDILHFRRLAKKNGIDDRIHVVSSGEEAIQFLLSQESRHGVAATLVMTDLNMPGMTGHELIEDIRANPNISNTVIFVVSTSDLQSDIARAYKNGVAGYIVKDSLGESFDSSIKMMRYYCDSVVVDRFD